MGRKKGKQSGNFHCKKLNAEHHHKLYVDHASEANHYRNPVSSNVLGKGLGYRSASLNETVTGRWDSNGRGCNGDKWSSIFANRSSSRPINAPLNAGSRHNQNAARGLAHLRHLLEDRRTEDRFHDRQFRLAVQRSRIRDSHLGYPNASMNNVGISAGEMQSKEISSRLERYEPGWVISQSDDVGVNNSEYLCIDRHVVSAENLKYVDNQSCVRNKQNRIPSLQLLAAQVIGPLLPMYVAACGNDFIGDCLKSASPEVIAQLSISLAKSSLASNQEKDDATYATTDGVVKALVHSGVATGLVLKGAPLVHYQSNTEIVIDENEDVDTRWLSDQGLLALCPRLLPQTNASAYCHDWETLDVDLDLTARMAGCFHLRRLELIDIPISTTYAHGGVTLDALRHVFQSCPGITHLSLSGCFYNWADMGSTRRESEDVSVFLCGTNLISKVSTERDRTVSNEFDQCGYISNQSCEVKGLHQLLPELQMLDLSHTTWLTPMMIFRFLLQCREGSSKLSEVKNQSNNTSEWDTKSTDQNHSQDSVVSDTNRHEVLSMPLRHLSVMGCNLSPEEINMIEEWISHSLFGSVRVLSSL